MTPRLAIFGLVLLGSLPLAYAGGAGDSYLCSRLQAIAVENRMPAIAAGIVLPAPGYPSTSPQPFETFVCASGVEKWGSNTPVTAQHNFPLGSITKPFTALMIARVIAQEALKPNPKITWNTRLDQFYPELFKQPGTNACYGPRTVADLNAHAAGFPNVPITEPGDQWTSSEPDPHKRRDLYVAAALKDPTAVPCTPANGKPPAQLASSYSGGVIIATDMVEAVTGRTWEDLMRHAGATTAGPGISVGNFAVPVSPVVWTHTYDASGNPVPVTPQTSVGWTNCPAGCVYLTASKMADMLKEWLVLSNGLTNAYLPAGEWATLTTRHHPDSYSRLGWLVSTTGFDSNSWKAPVAHWASGDPGLWKNGAFGSYYSEAYLVPAQNVALFFMLTGDDNGGPKRTTSLQKTLGELTALRLHAGDAAQMTWQQAEDAKSNAVGAMVAQPSSIPSPAGAIVDGKLTTKWSASPGKTTATFTLTFQEPKGLDNIVIVEDGGPRIQSYKVEYRTPEGQWVTVPTTNEPIYPHRFFEVPPPPTTLHLPGKPGIAVAKAVRFSILASSSPPRIVEIAAGNLGRSANASWWAGTPPGKL